MKNPDFEHLPFQVKKTLVQTAAFSIRAERKVFYTVIAEGECATFVGVELDTGRIFEELEVPGGTGSWTVVESDGRIYFGTYVNAGLYRYDPNRGEIEALGTPIPGAKFLYSLTADSKGNIYGGTWPNCGIFKFSGFENRVERHYEYVAKNENYVRFLLYNEERDKLYASIMSHSQILEFDFNTGVGVNILPEEYKNQSHVSVFGIKQDRLLAVSMLQKKAMVFDLDNRQMVLEVDFENKGIGSRETILENTVYFGHQNLLVGVDVITGKVDIKPFEINAIVRDPVELDDRCITGLCFDGDVYNYNIKTGDLSFRNIELPKKPIEIRQLHIDSNDMLYASGYLRGGTIVSDLTTGSWCQYEGVGQCEGITSHNGKVYFGKYPGSYVYEYDPDRPWDMQNGNPRLLFDLKVDYRQDRPFAMIAAEGRLYVGSIPDYGQIDGGLTIHDIVSGTRETRFDFSTDRSIVSLAVSSGVLFGGTTVCGGLGSHTVHSSGTLFAMNIESGEMLYDRILFDGRKNIGGLIALPDGRITGCADSTFFIYNPESAAVDMAREIAPHDPDRDYRWQISFMKIAPDGMVYGVTGWRLFRFNPANEAIDVLCDEDVYLLEIDSAGRIYTRLESDVRTIVRFG